MLELGSRQNMTGMETYRAKVNCYEWPPACGIDQGHRMFCCVACFIDRTCWTLTCDTLAGYTG